MRATRAIIDLEHVAHNVRVLRELTRPGTLQMAVVKADGYGHGAIPVARAALAAGAHWLAVATVEEGEELRAANLTAPTLLLGNMPPDQARRAAAADLAVTVHGPETLEALDAAGRDQGRQVRVHVKVDTGMGRLGIQPEEAVEFVGGLDRFPGIALEGVFSHFASADETDLGFAQEQLERFTAVLAALSNRGLRIPLRHMANTAATMVLPESHLDLVRNGIGIYGLYPSPEVPRTPDLRPALRWVTRVSHRKWVPQDTPLSYGCTHVTGRPSHVATLPVGYADGYPRLLSNRGSVLLAGRRAPVVGRVCMDMTLVDITDIEDVHLDSEAVLIGRQGEEEIPADEIAALTGTINYEVICNIGNRVPREYGSSAGALDS